MTMDPILDAFLELARRPGSGTIIASPTKNVTRHDLLAITERVVDWMARQQIPGGSLIALSAPNGSAFLALYLGIRMSGHPVLLLDHSMSTAELSRVLDDVGCRAAIVCNETWLENISDLQLIEGSTCSECGISNLPAGTSTVRLSSGTTGAARGIAHSSAGLIADDEGLRKTMGLNEEVALASVPFSHAYGFSSLVIPALTQEWKLIVPGQDGPLDPLKAARREGVTFYPTVPAFLSALVRLTSTNPFPRSLKRLICAGSQLDPKTATYIRQNYGLKVQVFYGASEVGGITFDKDGTAGERGTVGTPIEGVAVKIAESEPGSDRGGVIAVRSPAAGLGYVAKGTGGFATGWFKTSDLGYFDETGELVLVGRSDEIVKIRGKPVNPREVEAVLRSNPLITDVAVVPSGALFGPDEFLSAAVVPAATVSSPSEIFEWCRDRLAPHKIPRKLRFVKAIPRTSRGKVDHATLRMSLEDQLD